MDLLSMPLITLVVKAPNQKVADQTVKCDVGWTVQMLKEHLSDVYPSKPKKHDQRLIYSGQLLLDHMPLKDVLRQYTEGQTTHTVHLVCSQSHEQATHLHNTESTSTDPSENPQPIPSSSDTALSFPSDGLRHRSTPSTTPVQQNTEEATPQMFGGNPDFYGQMGMPQTMPMPGMMPGMMPYSPEQMMWMQQMYAQQMAQYMQYFHQADQPVEDDQTGQDHRTVNEEAVPNAPNQRRDAGNQQIRMNAQGGAVFDDDDEENPNRDWLDWLYTLSRFGVLLAIVYFYSTFSRFLLVFTFFTMVYLYQMGFFRLNRRHIPEPREEEVLVQQEEPQAEVEPDILSEDQEQEGTDSTDTELHTTPAEPPQPGVLTVAWTLFFTFFTSLLPEQPVPVNAN